MIRRSALAAALTLAAGAPAAGAAPVVTGTLHDAAGNPAPGVVTVHAWPTGRGKRAMKVVGRETVGPSGRFAVDVSDPVAAASAVAPRDDWADFIVVGETAGASGSTVTSAQVGGGTAAASALRPAEGIVVTADNPRPLARAGQNCAPPVSTRLGGAKSDGVIGEINNAYRTRPRASRTVNAPTRRRASRSSRAARRVGRSTAPCIAAPSARARYR